MHVVVCIKQVPDPQAPANSFYVDEAANEPRWSPPVQDLISTFDLHAIEAAAQLRDNAGATVTVLSLGGPDVEVGLRRALAGGCNSAIRIEAPGIDPQDRLAIAEALAASIRKLGDVDLVLCGRLAADWDMGHVPAMLAELLGFALVTPAIAVDVGDSGVTVHRLTDEGYDVLSVATPLVLAVSNEINEPRYPTMRAVLDSQREKVTVWTLDDLGLEPSETDRAQLQRLYGRDLTRMCEFVEAESAEDAGAALADLMLEKALV